MKEKFCTILLLAFLFLVMPAIGVMTNTDYFGYFLAQLSY